MQEKTIHLGFAEAKVPAGTHICQIYSHEDERNHALLNFVLQGVIDNELTTCFSENVSRELIQDILSDHGIDAHSVFESGRISLNKTGDIYFKDGKFDPDLMLELLTDFYRQSVENSFSGARVIGEMLPEINSIPGGSRLLEYESRVSLLLEEYPITAVCQYNAHSFDGASILDILKVHPMMIVRGNVVYNPYYIKPEEFLAGMR